MGARTLFTPLRVLTFAVVVALTIVACGTGGNADIVPEEQGQQQEQQQPEVAPAGQVTLQCTAECAARGQCGRTTDGTDVILLNREGPAVEPTEHDLVLPVNTPVTVQETRPVALVVEATGAQFQHDFHRVFAPQQNVEGWAAEWCLAGPVP